MSVLTTAYGRIALWWRELAAIGLSVAMAALLGLWLADWRAETRAAKLERALILERFDKLEQRVDSAIGGMSMLREKAAIFTATSLAIKKGQDRFHPIVVRLADEVAAREERAAKPKPKARARKKR